jgi:hypothetical protein
MRPSLTLRLPILAGLALVAMFLPFAGVGETSGHTTTGRPHASAVAAPHGPAACPTAREESESQGIELDLACDRSHSVPLRHEVSFLPPAEARESLAASLQTLHVRLDL